MKVLKDIDLGAGILSVDEVIDFLRICKTLKKLRFELYPHSKEENLLEHIGNEWRLSTNGDNIGSSSIEWLKPKLSVEIIILNTIRDHDIFIAFLAYGIQ